jgi:glycerate kinase
VRWACAFSTPTVVTWPRGVPPWAGYTRSTWPASTPRLRDLEVVVASDVDNRLTGLRGAAAVFGPQKGAGPADVEELEQALSQLASVIARQLGVDLAGRAGAGAAGGTSGGAVAFLGASIVSGIDLLLDLAHFPTAVRTAHLVITGEGSLDGQSLAGKAPWGVAQAAARAGVPVVALVGRSTLTDEEARAAGFAEMHALTHLEPDLERCQRDESTLLMSLARRLAQTSPQFRAAEAEGSDDQPAAPTHSTQSR